MNVKKYLTTLKEYLLMYVLLVLIVPIVLFIFGGSYTDVLVHELLNIPMLLNFVVVLLAASIVVEMLAYLVSVIIRLITNKKGEDND